jgi:hypothetical protein
MTRLVAIVTVALLGWAERATTTPHRRGEARHPCQPESAETTAPVGDVLEDCKPEQPSPIPDAAPIITIDDTRTHGPVARDWFNLSLDSAFLSAPPSITGGQYVDEDVIGLIPQLSIGVPGANQVNLSDLLAPYDVYEFRVRGAVFWHEGSAVGGPLTFAFQQYFPINRLDLSSLAAVHFGLETAVSTPWLSGRFLTPPVAVRVLEGVDTPLAQSGWSLRPLAGYFRADFLACRSLYAEIGGAPEVFIPGSGPTGYDARFHAAGGWSFTCPNQIVDARPKVSLEYSGRVAVPIADRPAGYEESIGAALQIDLDWATMQAFAAVDPRHAAYQVFGLRLQVGAPKTQAAN